MCVSDGLGGGVHRFRVIGGFGPRFSNALAPLLLFSLLATTVLCVHKYLSYIWLVLGVQCACYHSYGSFLLEASSGTSLS